VFTRGVDLNIALGGTFETMILVFIFEETRGAYTRSVNKVMRLIQYNSVLTFKLQN